VALGDDQCLVASAPQRPAEELLAPAVLVDVCRVQHVDVGVEGRADDGGGLGRVGRAAEVERAQRHRRHAPATASELLDPHAVSSRLAGEKVWSGHSVHVVPDQNPCGVPVFAATEANVGRPSEEVNTRDGTGPPLFN
jgi:hypothetical protein